MGSNGLKYHRCLQLYCFITRISAIVAGLVNLVGNAILEVILIHHIPIWIMIAFHVIFSPHMEHLCPIIPRYINLSAIHGDCGKFSAHIHLVLRSLDGNIISAIFCRPFHVVFIAGYTGCLLESCCKECLVQTVVHSAYTRTSDAALDGLASFPRCSSWLIIVVHDVHIHSFTAIAAVAAPVVYHVVTHIHPFVSLGSGTRTQSWSSRIVVGKQVMMIRRTASTPVATIAMGTFGMSGVLQTL